MGFGFVLVLFPFFSFSGEDTQPSRAVQRNRPTRCDDDAGLRWASPCRNGFVRNSGNRGGKGVAFIICVRTIAQSGFRLDVFFFLKLGGKEIKFFDPQNTNVAKKGKGLDISQNERVCKAARILIELQWSAVYPGLSGLDFVRICE